MPLFHHTIHDPALAAAECYGHPRLNLLRQRLVTRVLGLAGTPYARDFLTELAPNAGLLAAAEGYQLIPLEIRAVMSRE